MVRDLAALVSTVALLVACASGSGSETASESGSGSESASEPGSETGAESASETGAESASGSEPGSESGSEPGSEPGSESEPEPEPEPKPVAKAAPSAPAKRLFPPEIRSLYVRKSIPVRVAASAEVDKFGTLAGGTRVEFVDARPGPGCEKEWIQIRPRGWVCSDFLKPSTRDPRAVEQPYLSRREVVPGSYGKVIAEGAKTFKYENDALVEARTLEGSVQVRKYGEIKVEELSYWDIGGKEYIPVDHLRIHRDIKWRGARLGDDTGLELPVGFTFNRKNPSHSVPLYSAASGGSVVRKLAGRIAHNVLETKRNASGEPVAYRIKGGWVRASQLRVADVSPPPPGVGPVERWFDVDLDRQVLVAYEGELPVYATLVSTGSRKHPTETGVYRIWVKFAETDMSGQMGDESPYSVATVPWTQYYSKDLALHTSYWHDKFGIRKSHGCVNLAPIDSRFLYFWSEPQVPPGWSMAHGNESRPGSVVRVRSKADPDPPFRGYAKDILEARAGAK